VHKKIRKTLGAITWSVFLILLLIVPVMTGFVKHNRQLAMVLAVPLFFLSILLSMVFRATVRFLWPMPKGVHQVAYVKKPPLIAHKIKDGWTIGPPAATYPGYLEKWVR
jgi:hypothetical protein